MYAAAPDAAIVGERVALLVEDVVNTEVGAELLVELLGNNEVRQCESRVLINGARSPASADLLRIAVA